ncbi:MAG TPA: molybdopterin-dependent oxidoreductase, partial [Tepidiformaceae bacterium]|nr:molybdopterin-dependent oxidoreductase [Tepidiformaceae bacterium]
MNPISASDRYSQRWSWERATFGTHCLNCLATCPYRVYSRGGEIMFEEPAAVFDQIQEGVPDMNPMACQKGSAWSAQLDSPDRLLYPMRRKGERGAGEWERISWDEALEEVADAVIEAIDYEGPESVVFEETVEGGLLAQAAYLRFAGLIGATTLDANGLINDFPAGHHITFGKFSCASSVDDTFHSELILIWHSNPSYTSIPYAHFITEARYHGSRVVCIAPDYSPSALMADTFVPIRPATDAALALSMCQVIVEENLFPRDFVRSQTDLPLLVHKATRRFVRGPELMTGEREDQFYWWDQATGAVELAPRGSLLLDEADPALEGAFTTTGTDGTQLELTTVFELLKERLADYTPEKAGPICG